jgi:hypothetical protein
MSELILDKPSLVANIRRQFENISQLKYQRALMEFFDDDKSFIGDNVFETTFKLRPGLSPLAYEVSGPYCAASNEYATIGRIYENGQQIFTRDIKPQIQQRTAAMVWLFLSEIGHNPERILLVGAGKLALEIVHYLKHFRSDLSKIDYHARNRHAESFEAHCSSLGVGTNYRDKLQLSGYDTIIIATNTSACLIDHHNISSVQPGAVIASLCTTSQTGEIARDVYSHPEVNVIFDYELTRSFTADMRAADKAGHLEKVRFFSEVLEGILPTDMHEKINILRLTGTPMQNVAVLDMLHSRIDV